MDIIPTLTDGVFIRVDNHGKKLVGNPNLDWRHIDSYTKDLKFKLMQLKHECNLDLEPLGDQLMRARRFQDFDTWVNTRASIELAFCGFPVTTSKIAVTLTPEEIREAARRAQEEERFQERFK